MLTVAASPYTALTSCLSFSEMKLNMTYYPPTLHTSYVIVEMAVAHAVIENHHSADGDGEKVSVDYSTHKTEEKCQGTEL